MTKHTTEAGMLALAERVEPETEFIVHCPDCGHSWTLAYLPMTITKLALLAKASRCPKGCDAGPLAGVEPGASFLRPAASADPATSAAAEDARAGDAG
jgi:hypothetical protein